MIKGKDLEFYKKQDVVDPKFDEQRKLEIASQPADSKEVLEEIRENYPAASPADAGGDIDAEWQEVETTGSETVFGHNPTPDQSDVEANAHAMGIDFQDNEPLDFVKKMERRDNDRYELNENSRSLSGTI